MTSAKGDFKVLLPRPTTTVTTTAPAEDGAIVQNDVVGTGVEGGGVKFNVIRLSRSSGPMPNTFEQMLQAFSARGWRVVRRDVKLSGLPAVELHFAGPPQAMQRVLQHGNIVYELVVEFPPERSEETSQLAQKFWESFMLTR